MKNPEKAKKSKDKKTKTSKIIIILAWAIPAIVILTILYLNFLPFGYQKTFILDVGSSSDARGEFYLEENSYLGSRQSINDETFRYLDGLAYAVYEPKVVLKDAEIEASIEGQGIHFLTQPNIDIEWDYIWDANNIFEDFEAVTLEENLFQLFTNSPSKEISSIEIDSQETFALEIEWLAEMQAELLTGDISLIQNPRELFLSYNQVEITYPLPDFFIGENQTILIGFYNQNIYFFVNGERIDTKRIRKKEDTKITINQGIDAKLLKLYPEINPHFKTEDNCVYFNGQTRLILPDSEDDFEVGPFAIYLEWIPEKKEDRQQLMGHYNWEIWQNENRVRFAVGRMSTSTGSFHSVEHELETNFLYKKHDLLAIYNPANKENRDGYIELFVNGVSGGRQYFADEFIYPDYNKTQDLSFGWSPHVEGLPHFQGSICQAKFIYQELKPEESKNWQFISSEEKIKLPINGVGQLKKLKLNVKQK